MNLTATVVGAGILGLPYAYSRTGWVLGSLLLVVFGLLSVLGLHFISICARMAKKPVTFKSVGTFNPTAILSILLLYLHLLCLKVLPHENYPFIITTADLASTRLSVMIDVAVLTKCFGVACAYLIVIGDLMPGSMEHLLSITIPRQVCVIIGFLVAAPLCFYHQLDKLKYASTLSISFLLAVVVVAVIYSPFTSLNPCDEDACAGDTTYFSNSYKDSFKVLSIFVFGFTCHQNAYAIVNEMQRPTQFRIDGVFCTAITSGALLYLIVGISGYSTYGDLVQSNLLKSYPESNITMSICKLLVCCVEICHFPLQLNPARRAAMTLLSSAIDPVGYQLSGDTLYRRYSMMTCVLLVSSLLLALLVKDFGMVLEVIGATGSTLISFVLPALTFLMIFPVNFGTKYRSLPPSREKISQSQNFYGKVANCSTRNDGNSDAGRSSGDDVQIVLMEGFSISNCSNDDGHICVHKDSNRERELEECDQNVPLNDISDIPIFTSLNELICWRWLAFILAAIGCFVGPVCLFFAFL